MQNANELVGTLVNYTLDQKSIQVYNISYYTRSIMLLCMPNSLLYNTLFTTCFIVIVLSDLIVKQYLFIFHIILYCSRVYT